MYLLITLACIGVISSATGDVEPRLLCLNRPDA